MEKYRELEKELFYFLIIEDDEFNRIVLTDSLLDWNPNLTIDIADNGEIGVNMTEQAKYDMIFMDIQMPVMNGHQAVDKIKNSKQNKNGLTPIIAVTTHVLQTEKEYCLDNGMLAYITKPFEQEYLMNTVVGILAQGKASAIDEVLASVVERETVIDKSIILESTKGKPERLTKMIDLFLSTTPGELEKLQTYFSEKKYDDLRALAHSFKPKYAYMGMPRLSVIARQIEFDAATESNLAEIKSLILELREHSKIAYKELKELQKTPISSNMS